jgi:hypothetical protein
MLTEAFPKGQYSDAVHRLSVNQPNLYIQFSPELSLSTPPPTEEFILDRIWFEPSTMKRFCQVYLGQMPQSYSAIHPSQAEPPPNLDSETVYAILQQLPRQILWISYKLNSVSHCIAISTHPDKLLIFDPDSGLFQFQDLETLSKVSGLALQGRDLHWMAAFDLP